MVTVPKVTRVADGDRKAIAWVHPAGMDPSRRIASSYQNPDLKHPMRRGGVLGACGCEVRLRPINILMLWRSVVLYSVQTEYSVRRTKISIMQSNNHPGVKPINLDSPYRGSTILRFISFN
jgi:hypothetical protein